MTKSELIKYLETIPGDPVIQSVDREGQLSTEIEIAWDDEVIAISAEEHLEEDDGPYNYDPDDSTA